MNITSSTVTIVVETPAVAGTITNTAEVTSSTSDPVAANNSDTENTTLGTDLSVSMSDSPDPVTAGSNVTYTVTVTNNGPATSTSVTLTDSLPVAFASVTSTQGTCSESGGTVTCNLGTLASNASSTTTIVGTAPSCPVTNSASVSGSGIELNPADNTVAENTTVLSCADVSVVKLDSADPSARGGGLTYTLFVANNGPATSTGVVLTDVLPAGVTFVSVTSTVGACSESAGTVSCDIGNLSATNVTSSKVTIVTIAPLAVNTISNTASVTSTTFDPNAANDSDTESTTLGNGLSLVKSDAPDPVTAGNNVTYTLIVTNDGATTSTSVVLTDTLPSGVGLVSATSTQGTCAGTSTITCNLGGIGSGSSVTVTIVVSVVLTTPCPMVNAASVAASEPDPDPSDNTATTNTTVLSCADLAVDKSDSPDPVSAGSNLTYTVTVSNNGPGTSTAVVLTDNLTTTATFVSAASTQGSCAESGGTVTCNIGDMTTSTVATVTIVITSNTAGTIVNTVSVSSAVFDPVSANNSGTETTTGVPSGANADLSVTESDSPDPVTVGSNITYTITVVNNGPSTSTAVTLTENLPATVTYVTSTPSQGSCTESGGTVTCSLGILADGAASNVSIVVTADTAGTVSSTASVSGPQTDPDTNNNSAMAVTTVSSPAPVPSVSWWSLIGLAIVMAVAMTWGSDAGLDPTGYRFKGSKNADQSTRHNRVVGQIESANGTTFLSVQWWLSTPAAFAGRCLDGAVDTPEVIPHEMESNGVF